MKTRPTFHTLCALVALALCSAVAFADIPSPGSVDAAGLQAVGTANQKTAHALEVASAVNSIADASKCTTNECVVSVKAMGALSWALSVVAERGGNALPAAAPTIINAAPPPTVGERIVGLFAGTVGKIFDTAVALGPSYLNYRLGTVQSNNSTTLGLRQSDNALGATVSTNGTFAAFGNNLQGTAIAGFGTAATLGTRPTSVTTITGNGNATNGSTVTTTTTSNTNNCPAGSGGDGSGAASGNAGQGPSGGTSGQGGTGTAGVGGTANCNAGK